MRKLMWFTVGFGIADIVGIQFLWGHNMTLWWVSALVLSGVFLLVGMRCKTVRFVWTVFFGISVCLFILSSNYQKKFVPLYAYDDSKQIIEVTATSFPEETEYGVQLEGEISLCNNSYKIQVYFKGDYDLKPGDIIRGEFHLKVTAPGGVKESNFYQGNGIFLTANQKGDISLDRTIKIPFRYFPVVMAKNVKHALKNCFSPDVFPVAQAILLGDCSELDYATNSAFKVSGIRHIVAVSGLHVAFIYGLISFITRRNRYLNALIGLPILFLFAAIAGFTPSVTRATIMVSMMIIANLISKEYDSLTGLSLAALIMILQNPFIITSVSFLLSVCSVAGILLFQPTFQAKFAEYNRYNGLIGKVISAVMSSLSVTLAALILTVPLNAVIFHSVSLSSLVTNVLVLWVVGFIFCGILIVGFLGQVWLPGGKILAAIVAWPIRYVIFVTKLISQFPYSAIYTNSIYIVVWLVILYCSIIIYLFIRRGKLRYWCSALAAALLFAIILSAVIPRLDKCRISVLDVGEGQCILIQCDGKEFIVDCGGSSAVKSADAVAEILLSQGIRKIDGLMMTHYDRDHVNGIMNLATRIDVRTVFLPAEEEEGFELEMRSSIDANYIRINNKDSLQIGNGTITFFRPSTGNSKNEKSVGILFEQNNCAILITGDQNKKSEIEMASELGIHHVDALVVGHHGSKSSTSNEFLDMVQPRYAIISVGAGNTYGHPAPETLQRLRDHNCTVLRTDIDGTVIYRR